MGLHHLMEGPEDAPVLVFSNSLGTTLEMWREQAPALRERFRLLRYDHRGHGGSPVPPGPYTIEDLGRDVTALLDRLGVERFSFCGLSIGGWWGCGSRAKHRSASTVWCSAAPPPVSILTRTNLAPGQSGNTASRRSPTPSWSAGSRLRSARAVQKSSNGPGRCCAIPPQRGMRVAARQSRRRICRGGWVGFGLLRWLSPEPRILRPHRIGRSSSAPRYPTHV